MDPQVFLVLVGAGAASLLLTLGFALRAHRFLARALRAAGKVTRVEPEQVTTQSYGSDHPEQTSTSFRPHVEFQSADGSRIEFPSAVAHPGASLYQVGDAVTVVYDRADPRGTAEIAGPVVWRATIFSGIGTGLLLLVTVLGKACN